MAEFAKSSIFEITNLRVGKIAPEIVGEDLAGEAFKLSDYRGKVVLLSFWASWCGPCMAEIPFEKELVETYDGRPFAIVGVNGDFDQTWAAKAVEGHAISWRSFAGSPEGPFGPIARAWNVSGWPTIYLIDPSGVIRDKRLPRDLLEKKIADLVQEAELARRD